MLDLAGARAPGPVGADDRAESPTWGRLLDARARAEYRRRLAELDDEVDDAEQRTDPRARRARLEPSVTSSPLSSRRPSASTADPDGPATPPSEPARP